jgi:phosphocarrier protein HPr
MCRQDGDLNPARGVAYDVVAQAQANARRVPLFNDGQNSHYLERESSRTSESRRNHQINRMRFRDKRQPVTVQREVRVTNELGMHARPAAEFVSKASSFRSEIWLIKNEARFSASSVIDVLRANLECGAAIRLEAYGVDAAEAVVALEILLSKLHD